MKTTVEINDALFLRAKKLAAERQQTLKAIIDSALQEFLEKSAGLPQRPFKLRKHTFRGRGLQPGLDDSDWGAIRERAYEGRGG